jgi:tetratricopeptide (TPR) repeat protein
VLDWESRLAAAWDAFDDDTDPVGFRARISALAAELPAGDPIAAFERAGAYDATDRTDLAVPLYRAALAAGLPGDRRRRAVVQLASSLRWLGRTDESISLLEREIDAETGPLDDAVRAFLALALADAGRPREALRQALTALIPHLPAYQRSLTGYAAELTGP